ncbi:MAG: YIP1 family protein [Planctomycetota bacterium]
MSAAEPSSSAPGLHHAPMMFVAPRTVFQRIAESGRYGWTLGALILLTTLIGWATVQTGLIDQQVDRGTLGALAELEREQIDLLSRVELSERMERIRKGAEFNKLIARGSAMLVAPVMLVASLMLIAALLFAVVALTGHKPDYPTLMAVCVYSAVVHVLAAGLRLAMMLYYRTIEVDTSLGLLVPLSEETRMLRSILSAVDPFAAWFWILVALGLVITGQLSRRAAVVTCALFWLIATGAAIIPAQVGLPNA